MRGALIGGRYRLGEPLGSGGMGTVWRATDTYRQRRVAVKTVTGLAEGVTSDSASRFRREIQVASLLRNPHIVEMHDAGEAVVDGRPVLYLVMEEIPGEPLSRVLAVRRPSLAEVARWGGEICEALAAMHGAGIVHRDLKPANVMIGPDGHVTVLDFGIARLDATGIDLTTLTRTGHVLGTVAFMSPEQAGGGGDVDARSDLYSLGCLLYATLTGRPPFPDGPWQFILRQHMDEVPAAPGLRRDGLPSAWDTLVLELLAKRPEYRPRSAVAVRERLAALPLPRPAPPEPVPPERTVPEGASVTAGAPGATAGPGVVGPDEVMTERMTPDGPAPGTEGGTGTGSPGSVSSDAVPSALRAADTGTRDATGGTGRGGAAAANHPPTRLPPETLAPTRLLSGDVISRGLTWGRLLAFLAGVVVLLVGLVAIVLIVSGRGAGQAVSTSGLIVVGGFGAFVALGVLSGVHGMYVEVWRPRRLERRFRVWSWADERHEAFRVVDRAMRRGRWIEVCFAPEDGGYLFLVVVPTRFVESGLVGTTRSGEELLLPDAQLVTVKAVREAA
ncbi:serine/threonine-protein kinase [Streptomyces sp. NPDC019224]|uniref:serine/threonine-protein kinase n=1 Tax=Streptomyces sp. NPDC019224 TaxID=3154484 RepID=UPI0033E61FA6